VIRENADLPDDVTTLQALLLEERARLAKVSEELASVRAETASYKAQIEHLKAQRAKLRRARFGRSSEKLDQQIAQLELLLEDLEESAAQDEAKDTAVEESSSDQTRPAARRRKPAVRRPLPEHLPRETVELDPEIACACCQPQLTRIGEDVTEVLETIPAQLKVIPYVRPKLACRACQAVLRSEHEPLRYQSVPKPAHSHLVLASPAAGATHFV
jgi:predicted nuclease with TOPRIM domain